MHLHKRARGFLFFRGRNVFATGVVDGREMEGLWLCGGHCDATKFTAQGASLDGLFGSETVIDAVFGDIQRRLNVGGRDDSNFLSLINNGSQCASAGVVL